MPSRTARFGSALFGILLAGVSLTTASHGAPAEPEQCLAGPQGTAPAGGHWYYRVERGTKRHCWYIGDAKEKVARTALVHPPASADPLSPPKNAAANSAVVDARAELPAPRTQAEPATGNAGQRIAAAPADAAGTDTNQRASVSDTNAQSSAALSVIASRWPESSGVNPSASQAPAPATYQPPLTVQPDAAAAPAPAFTPVTLAAADASAARQSGSIQTIMIVVIGSLALAGLTGGAIFRFGGMRWSGGRDVSGDRRPIWDMVSPPMIYPGEGAPMSAVRIPRQKRTRVADDASERITEMLARLSRTSTT